MNKHTLFKTGFNDSDKIIKLNETQLEQLKETLIDMLKDFDEFAKKHQIRYTLSGGSVLGAVRHNGIIPWDDDIDINIPRADFNRLLDIFPGELADRYILCSPERTANHGILCAQIKKRNTLYKSFNELSKDDHECGICMDIFVVENTFNNSFLRLAHGCLALAFGYLVTCRKTYHDMPFLEPYLIDGSQAKNAFKQKARIGKCFKWLSLDRVTRWANTVYSMCNDDTSTYVTIPSGRNHYFKEMHLRTHLCETVNHQFEGMNTKIPKDYNAYLTKLYGKDYMIPPSKPNRESHPIMKLVFDTQEETKDEIDDRD